MSIYPFLHPGRCLSYKFPTSVFPACEFPVTFSNALSASSLLMFPDTFPHIFPVIFSNALSASSLLMFFNAFSYTFSCSFLKCFSGAFTLYENYSSTPEKYKTGGNPDVHPPAFRLFSASFATLSATSFACSLQASLRFLQRVPPVSLHLLSLLFSGFLFLYCTLLFLLPFFPALQNNADHPAIVVVHNFLHGIL